jgi:hypothetical protein
MQEVETNLQEVVFDHLHSTAFQVCNVLESVVFGGFKFKVDSVDLCSRISIYDYLATNFAGHSIGSYNPWPN